MDRIAQYEAYIVKRAELPKLVEQPCLDACIQLYDKNIRTVSTNGNIQYATKMYSYYHDTSRGGLFIHIDYDSLSDENKQIAQELRKERKLFIENYSTGSNGVGMTCGGIKSIVVIILKPTIQALRPEFDIEGFLNYANEIVNKFKPQDVLFGNGTISDVIEQIKIIENITDENGLYKFLFEKKVIDNNKNINIDNLLILLSTYKDTEVVFKSENGGIYQTINVYKVYDEESDRFWANEELLQKHKEYIMGNTVKR